MTAEDLKELRFLEKLSDNAELLTDIFRDDDIFRLRYIVSKDGSRRYFIAYFDGMVNNEVVDLNIIRPLMYHEGQADLKHLAQRVIATDDAKVMDNLAVACAAMISGDTLIIAQGYAGAVAASSKGFKTRGVDEPEMERALRGPREGFTESLVINTSLLRRKLMTPDLKFVMRPAAEKTGNMLCLCYLDGVVDRDVLDRLVKRLSKIRPDHALSANYIDECIRDSKGSPFKTVGVTEKPDIAAAKILEGKVVILLDGTPGVLSVPFLFLEYFQSGSDYYTNFWLGSIERFLRIFGMFLSVSVPAFYVALVCFHHEMLPVKLLLSIASSREGVPLSAALELFVMLAAFELLRQAGVMMPQGVGNALSTLGGVVIGQAAVEARFISAPLVIIVAFTGLTDSLLPKMKEEMILMRFTLLALSSFIGIYGYILGVLVVLIILVSMESFGVPYTSFLATWRASDIRDSVIRLPLSRLKKPSVREEDYK